MANRYWVGGTASWDGTAGTKWALTSGGAGGQTVPTSVDDVFFSNLSTGTCTIALGNTGAKSINCTGFTGTLAGSTNITVSGSVTLAAAMTFSYTGILFINATAILTTAGKTLLCNISINAPGGTVTLGDAIIIANNNGISLNGGSLDLNGFSASVTNFVSNNSNSRSIAFGSQNITLTTTNPGTPALNAATATNFTYTGTGGFIRVQAATTTISFGSTAGGSATNAPNLTVNTGASTLTFSSTSHFKTINFTGSTCAVSGSVNIYSGLTLASGGTYTSLNPTFRTTLTFSSLGKTLGATTVSGSGITVTLGSALTLGVTNNFILTEGTLDLNGFTLSAGGFSSTNSNTRAIIFGSANIALTSTTAGASILIMATVTNFTYTGTGGFTRNMAVTAAASFGSTAGGSTTNAPNLTVNAGASALTLTGWFKNLIFTGSTCAVSGIPVNVAGDVTLASGGTYTAFTPAFRSTGTITSTGKTLNGFTVDGSGITVTCTDALTTTNALTLTNGTLELKNGVTSTVGAVVTTGTTLKYLKSTVAGSQATISDSTSTNTVTYLLVQDSNATGGAVFSAVDPTNLNGGNNTGWIFGGSGNMFLVF